MLDIFRRCFNRIGAYFLPLGYAKGGENISYPRCGEASHFIVRQPVTLTGTMYPPPPPR